MLRSSVVITLLSLFGSVLGFVAQLLLAERFGLGLEVDAYLFAMSVPTFVAGMLSAMMSYAVIPRLVACEKDILYQRRYMGSLLIGMTTMALLMMGLLNAILKNFQRYALSPDSPIPHYDGLSVLILLACLVGACMTVQGCITAMLNSVRQYVASSALGLLSSFGMVVSLLILGPVIGIIAIPMGMLSGIVIGILGGVFLLRGYLFPLPWKSLLWLELGVLMHSSLYTAIAMSCFSSYVVVDAYFAPQAGTGTLATLGYAQRLVIGFGTLVVAGPSAVVVPRMAELLRDQNYIGFWKFLLRAITAIAATGSILALSLAVFAEPLIRTLFARGQFGEEQVSVLASTLRYMTPGMVTMLTSSIVLRSLFCFRGAERVASLLGLTWSTLYSLTSFLMYKNGAPGIAAGYSIVWIIFFILVVVAVFFGYAGLKLNQ